MEERSKEQQRKNNLMRGNDRSKWQIASIATKRKRNSAGVIKK
jgi:hypothetical protein